MAAATAMRKDSVVLFQHTRDPWGRAVAAGAEADTTITFADLWPWLLVGGGGAVMLFILLKGPPKRVLDVTSPLFAPDKPAPVRGDPPGYGAETPLALAAPDALIVAPDVPAPEQSEPASE